MKYEIEQEVEKCYQRAELKLGRTFQRPRIDFSLTGTCAGKAGTFRNLLFFNLGLAIRNPETFLKRTVPHEVAHMVADAIMGKRCIHGPYWKHIMRSVFGLEPIRCHSYDVSEVVTRRVHVKFDYSCPCGKVRKIGKNRHFKIQSLGKKYYCIHCKGRIFPVESQPVVSQSVMTFNQIGANT